MFFDYTILSLIAMSPLVLLTGGCGFIGKHLSQLLVSHGFSVRILDTLSPQIHGDVPDGLEWLDHSSIEFLRGSVTEQSDIERALIGVTCVVHLAAETGTGQSMYEISRYNFVNSQGTAQLLEVLSSTPNHSVSRFILASSRSIYGEGAYACRACSDETSRLFPPPRSSEKLASHRWNPICPTCGSDLVAVPTRETDPVLPASVYAATKYAQEDLVRIVSQSIGIDHAILRFQNVYGEGQSLKNPYTGILSIFSTRIRRGIELPIFEDGLESRDFVHVEDVARAVMASISSPSPLSGIINVGSGVGTTVIDVAEELMKALGIEVPLRITGEYRLGDIRHNIADISRLRMLLPGGPQVTLAEGLTRFAKWVKTQPLPEDLLDSANKELRERKLMA
ncbi:MAG: NAD-dependent epimerase/dehydratase family protein [Synechococcus sp.]